uniref:Uncharacterized protein n=1 Tax=Acinetobacter phage vB_Ab_1137_KEN_01 TaxID=3143009 RepID=A0AAU8KY33_9VIRU
MRHLIPIQLYKSLTIYQGLNESYVLLKHKIDSRFNLKT